MNEYKEIWQCLKILGKEPNSFWETEKIKDKLIALERISEIGLPNTISYLIPFLKKNNPIIRERSCDIIIIFFKRIKNKSNFYDILKHCDIDKSDIVEFSKIFSPDKYIYLLIIASLNKNGHIRQEAVSLLGQSKNKQSIPFLIYRLADWVEPVRKSAYNGLKNYISNEYLPNLIEHLPLFEWLQKVERVNLSNIHKDVLDFIIHSNRSFLWTQFYTFKDKIRLIIAKSIILQADKGEITLLLNDKYFQIRSLTLSKYEKLSEENIKKLLSDQSPKIRLETLYKFRLHNEELGDIPQQFLADNSASIRAYSRFILREASINFQEKYYQNLLNQKQILGSILGLAETNGKEYKNTILEFWQKDNIKIKKAVFSALIKLDEDEAYKIALDNFDSDILAIRTISLNLLSTKINKDILVKVRKAYQNGNIELRKSILKFFHKVGSWTGLADLMLGTIDENADIRNLSCEYLRLWKNKAVRIFTKPTSDESERSRKIFIVAYEFHEKKCFFKENPLKDLDFYIK